MRSLRDLKTFAGEAASLLARDKDLAGWELYCSSAAHRVARLNCTSDIPSRGIEEFKSLNADGFALRIATRHHRHETGAAIVAGDFSAAAIRDALTRARAALVIDPHFPGLPASSLPLDTPPPPNDLVKAGDDLIAGGAWRIIAGALETFERSAPLKLARPGLILGGDLSLIHDRVAVASSEWSGIRVDETAHFSSSVTALIEALDAKGTATATGATAAQLSAAAQQLGADAVTRALGLRHGERPPPGAYRVVLGAQPLAEIVNYLVLGSLTTGAFYAANSAYQERFGAEVMDPRLSLLDDPQYVEGPIRRAITCEGLPARRTDLIRDGRLIGLLSNHYDRNRLLTDQDRAAKLGPAAPTTLDFYAASGYRLGEGGARRFDSHPAATGTNVILRSRDGHDQKGLLAAVGDGIYIGRVWYTYPINGQRAGDFTCTISGNSWLIREGKLAAPLAPNCLRINANLAEVFTKPLAVGAALSPTIVWGAPEIYFMPEIAIEALTLTAINPAQSR